MPALSPGGPATPFTKKESPTPMTREFPKNPEPKNIALPTVGRIVHVFGITQDGGPPEAPRAGLVCGTEPGQLTINAAVWTRTGDAYLGGIQNLVHASMPRHPQELYWDWMEFQKGQAAKAEQLEAELKSHAKLGDGASASKV